MGLWLRTLGSDKPYPGFRDQPISRKACLVSRRAGFRFTQQPLRHLSDKHICYSISENLLNLRNQRSIQYMLIKYNPNQINKKNFRRKMLNQMYKGKRFLSWQPIIIRINNSSDFKELRSEKVINSEIRPVPYAHRASTYECWLRCVYDKKIR